MMRLKRDSKADQAKAVDKPQSQDTDDQAKDNSKKVKRKTGYRT